MKNKFLFLTLFLSLSFSLHAESENKNLLDMAKVWVDTSLQCENHESDFKRLGPNQDWGKTYTVTPTSTPTLIPTIGPCSIVGKPLYCHLHSPTEIELILQIKGIAQPEVGGGDYLQDQFILFNNSQGKLKAQVFYKTTHSSVDAGASADIIEFPGGGKMVRVFDGEQYCDSSSAHLFKLSNEKLEIILDYPYMASCARSWKGFSTLLIPLKNKSIRLLKLAIGPGSRMSDLNPTTDYSDYYFDPDPDTGIYKMTQDEKHLTYSSGFEEWQEEVEILKRDH